MTDEPLFYANGREIWRRTESVFSKDGERKPAMGFLVCDVSPYIDETGPQEIAAMLNAGHAALYGKETT